VPIPATEDTERTFAAFWSPDSRSLGFFAGGKLKRVDLGGGTQVLAAAPEPRGGTWTSDGTIVFNPDTQRLYRMPASGGEPPTLVAGQSDQARFFPRALPDGHHVLECVDPATSTFDLWLRDLQNPIGASRLTSDGRSSVPVFSPVGDRILVMERDTGLAMLPIRGGSSEPLGPVGRVRLERVRAARGLRGLVPEIWQQIPRIDAGRRVAKMAPRRQRAVLLDARSPIDGGGGSARSRCRDTDPATRAFRVAQLARR